MKRKKHSLRGKVEVDFADYVFLLNKRRAEIRNDIPNAIWDYFIDELESIGGKMPQVMDYVDNLAYNHERYKIGEDISRSEAQALVRQKEFVILKGWCFAPYF